MKKYFGILISLIGLIGTSVFATYEDFSQQLKNMGLDVKTIESQDTISRYDLSRLLSSVECKDCINPNEDMVKKYVQEFWSNFTTGKDFSDINFLGGIYNNVSYYYCVAYVGDNTYMRGYPKATSPVCSGQFCGTKKTTTAEFIQVVINILAKYIYKDLSLNRKEVNTRINNLKIDSYEAKNFTTDDKKNIKEKSKTCNTICALKDAKEVNLYLKYCMFNLTKCNMQEIGKIKQGYWPVAEINLLYAQNLIDIDQSQRGNTDKNIAGKTVLETLFKLNGKIDCTFNNNYDCDGIDNAKDNCPNTYNPTQKDTNNNKIGDVCDNDIDGDGIKNSIGIVDEEGKIDIAKWSKNTDNCLFVINTGQEDTNQNNIGDACENINNQIGVYIMIDELKGSAPVSTTFTAITKGNIKDVIRNFGDGTQGKGPTINHTFISPGMYNVQATVKGNTTEAKAQIIVIVGGQIGDDRALQTKASVIGGKNNTESTLSVSSLGNFDNIERVFPKENISSKKGPNESIKRIFKETGENPVIVKGYSNGQLVGVSYFTIGVDQGKGAILKSNTINPEINKKILFDTTTYNIAQKDILTVHRDFGDTTKKENTTLTMEYTYTKPGKKVVTQTITLTNGKVLTNSITINIIDKTVFASYALLMIPSSLVANIGDKITFSTRIVGTWLNNPLIQIAEFGDGITQKKAGTEKIPNTFIHTYQKNDILTPQENIYINQCSYLKNQATIVINGVDSCLNAKTQGTLNSTYKCDLDGDKIPDICDTDIDGDEIQNLLGLINFENKDCSYESDPSKTNANINQEILIKHYQSICSLDNAPFSNNSNQLDLNQDGIGDSQDTTFTIDNGENVDKDGDGIVDIRDLCPTIQETRNGINDNDGCPEIGLELGCNQQGINNILGIINTTIIINPIDTIVSILSCGNGKIDPGENCNNCATDVGTCISLSGGISDNLLCGNGVIDTNENCMNCPLDVGACVTSCGNTKIEAGENCLNCPQDVKSCGTCGDGKKDATENCSTCPQDYGICINIPTCGNGLIDKGETCINCPQDIRRCIGPGDTCGNNVIDTNETCFNCPQDIGICGGSGTSLTCGNDVIDTNETCLNCPQDVGTCVTSCSNDIIDINETCLNCPIDIGICGGSGTNLTCGNGIIDTNENCMNCPLDVGTCVTSCGNTKIEAGENCLNCPQDVKSCGTCGDGKKDATENCSTCPQDYGICINIPTCGNGLIDKGETCLNCPQDVRRCIGSGDTCGNNIIDTNETCLNCPIDIGTCGGSGTSLTCDNGIIDTNETCLNCPQDIGICGGSGTSLTCGNGVIDTNENCMNCPLDVGECVTSCGNTKIEAGENCLNCPQDVKSCGTCGDGKKDATENCSTCPQDYGICINIPTCGNGLINQGETCLNCPQDVRRCIGSGDTCGNNIIDTNETCLNCPIDIGTCGGSGTSLTCGNGVIDTNENCMNCPLDVGACVTSCGNTKIEEGENCLNCPQDVKSCGTCGDGKKDATENCSTCPQDYGICINIPTCGNGLIDKGETCLNCPQDVRRCIGSGDTCGNNIIDTNETCLNCPQDIGICGGSGSNISGGLLCGNGNINPGETCSTCPQDIGILCIDVPEVGTCNQCPCQFADFASDLTNNDQVRAILRNTKKTIQYKFSLPRIVDFQQ